jgi:tetratricopeptide (TPR) repeat protein
MIHIKKNLLKIVCLFVTFFVSVYDLTYALDLPNKIKIIDLLKHRGYEELETRLSTYQKAYEKDYKKEDDLVLAYDAFYIADPTLEIYLNEWIKRYPNSYSAQLARGIYYTRMGWLIRGSKYIHKTPQEQIEGMKNYFSKAVIDIETALRIHPKAIVGYNYLISIEMASGDKGSKRILLNKALQMDPGSFGVRRYYLHSLVPRWSGSIEEMRQFLDETERYLSKNPKLKVLGGYIDFEKGNIASNSDDRAVAIEYYTKALSFGDYPLFLRERGEAYYRTKQYDKALSDINKALEFKPEDPEALCYRGKIYQRLGKNNLALSDLNLAVQLDPLDTHTLAARAHLYEKLERYSDALKDYEDALLYSKNYPKIWKDRGMLLARKFKDYKNARQALDKAIALDPNDVDAWYFHGLSLYHLHERGAAAVSFAQYLKLSKDNTKQDKEKISWVEKFLACEKNPSSCK